MSRDEFGMPVPDDMSPLPRSPRERNEIRDHADWSVVSCEDGFDSADDRDFVLHAANNIIPAREIVRRLAISKGVSDLLEIAADAEKLWSKMQKDIGDE